MLLKILLLKCRSIPGNIKAADSVILVFNALPFQEFLTSYILSLTSKNEVKNMRAVPEKFIKARKYAAAALLAVCAVSLPAAVSAEKGFSEFTRLSSRLSVQLLYGYSGQEIPGTEDTDNSLVTADTPKVYTYTEYSVDDSLFLSSDCRLVPSAANEDITSADPETAAADFSEDGDYLQGGKIISTLYGFYSGEDYLDLKDGGQVRNLTHIGMDELEELSSHKPSFEIKADGEPEVLIMHTHTTECYEPYERDYYDLNRSCRVLDGRENMTAVGDMITKELYKMGIGVVHDTTVHDYPDYNGSYDRSRKTVCNILEQYPSIKVVLDIHRDAIERDGDRIAPVTEINGRSAAQIMIICGCDDGTMDMPDCLKNFSFACALQSRIETDNPTLTRPVLFDYRHYNQDLTTGSLLIEVGSHGNTLEQAKYSGELIGKSLAGLLLEEKENK